MSIVELKRQVPLTDIPARLRLLADKIESGEYPEADLCLVVLRMDASKPEGEKRISQFAYGNYHNVYECDGLMLYAIHSGGKFS